MYSGNAQDMIRNCLEKISVLSLETYNYNVDDFVTAVEVICNTLKNSVGSYDNEAAKVYEVLSRSTSEEFNTQLQAWNAAQENTANDASLDILQVLYKAKSYYMSLVLQNRWIKPNDDRAKPMPSFAANKHKDKDDIAALHAEFRKL